MQNTKSNSQMGYVLIGIGILLVALRVIQFDMMGMLWPLWIIAPGAAFFYFAHRGDESQVGLAVPGAVIGGTGLILAFFNVFGHWEAWAYAWTLYPVFVGLALSYMANRRDDDKLAQSGRTLVRIGLYLFLGFGLFFEVLIFGGFTGILTSNFLPLVLMAIGVYIIMNRNDNDKQKRKNG